MTSLGMYTFGMVSHLPNKPRNDEVAAVIAGLKGLDLGSQSSSHMGRANALASLDVAESLQLLQLQLSESTSQTIAAHKKANADLIASNERLSASNDRHARAMQWLTGALVLVGLIQIAVSFIH